MLKITKKNRRAWLIFLYGILLILFIDRAYVFQITSYSTNEQTKQAEIHEHNNNGTNSPFLAFIADIEGAIDAHEKLFIVLATIAIAWFTATLWDATAGLFFLAKTQAKDMKISLRIADQSANAMEKVANATKNNAVLMQGILSKQMRAYLAVDIGQAVYQDQNLRFGSSPVLTNTGFTPAKNVSFRVMADVLPIKLPENFQFADFGEKQINDASLAPRQQFVIHGVVKNKFPDDEVQAIMEGNERRLFVWGTVTYDDVFGGSWETNFCHTYTFFKDGDGRMRPNGFYHPKHNSST